nr:MAG: hypothetical protein [Bacteriophage sp.]
MSDIVMHPLTALNGSPEYTADDFRHAVTPLLSTSAGNAFESVQAVRFGSPVPLVTISGLTVTVKAHCGIVSPWTGVGTYTYAIKNPVSVLVPDSTGSYKIAVVVDDPSQAHGTVPCGAVKVFSASVPNANIPGLVIALVNAGVVSDAAPRFMPDGRIEVMSLGYLAPIVTMNGIEAVVKNTGDRYRRVNGTWVPLTNISLKPGQWYKDWASVEYKCSMSDNIVSLYVKATRGPEWKATAWSRSQILTFPDYVKPNVTDLNVPAAGVANSGFQLDSTGLYVRPFADVTYAQGSWTSTTLTWSV